MRKDELEQILDGYEEHNMMLRSFHRFTLIAFIIVSVSNLAGITIAYNMGNGSNEQPPKTVVKEAPVRYIYLNSIKPLTKHDLPKTEHSDLPIVLGTGSK